MHPSQKEPNMKGITGFALNNSRTGHHDHVAGDRRRRPLCVYEALPKLEDPFITIREAVVVAQVSRHAGGATSSA
jgi:hypothetical protein